MIFIDTGAFLARYLARDAYHELAMPLWKSLVGTAVYTSNHVISETLTLLARRVSCQFAAERAEAIYFSREMEILHGSKEDEIEAVRLFCKFGDQRVSFTDCVSFVLMKRHGLRTAFTFDRHFRAADFGVLGTSW